ncbi:hypothetical protein [Mediterraneibacter agrestimuris]|uniref:hypothetical protein n=1 Tax=Mediterraneibacter agrestimuris TaxID=2941333 RepID=UPI00203F321E|nr:hypothetical protein [Mediterraneibacter agrestimuris]
MFKGIVSAGVYVITAIISLFVLKLYFGTFFKLKREIRTYYIWIIYIVWQLLLYGRSGLPAYINLFIGFLLNCSVAIISYSGKLIQKIALAGMLSMLWTLSEFFVGYFFLALGIDYENPMILGAILSEGVVIIIIICLKKFFQHENIKSLPIKHNIALLLIPIGSLFVVYPMFMFNEKRIDGSILCLVIMLFINLITFRLYGVLAEEMEQRRYNSVYTQQLELCNKHNKEKEIAMLEYRNIKHDIKQHYISLLAMLEEEKYTMAKQYLSDLVTGSKEHKTSVCNTENLVVDAIINAKYSVMKLT